MCEMFVEYSFCLSIKIQMNFWKAEKSGKVADKIYNITKKDFLAQLKETMFF